MARLLPIVTVVGACLALAACGSDDDDGGAEPAGGAASGSPVEISATNFRFEPAEPGVEPGNVEFRLTNDGEAPHALVVEGPGGSAETDVIQPGEEATLRADLSEAGEFTMFCPVGNHRQLGMEGTVTVGDGGGGSGSGGETTEEDSGGRGGY